MRGSLVASALVAVLISSTGSAEPAPSNRLEILLRPTAITVGDPVEVTVRYEAESPDEARRAELVLPAGGWGRAEILTAPTRTDDPGADNAQSTWTFTVTAFETGRLELPPLELRLAGEPARTVRSPTGAELEVRSVLPPGQTEVEPAPAVAPRPLPVPSGFWWTSGALAGGILAAGLALAQRARGRAEPAPPPATALAELRRALEDLDRDGADAGSARLSAAVRGFLGRSCGFPAPESTTTQVARRLLALGIEPSLAARFRTLLADCDAVKFARRRISAAELGASRDLALELAAELEKRDGSADGDPSP